MEASEKAVKADPTWSIARQTQARAQIAIGEIEMVRSTSFPHNYVIFTLIIGIGYCSEILAFRSFQCRGKNQRLFQEIKKPMVDCMY